MTQPNTWPEIWATARGVAGRFASPHFSMYGATCSRRSASPRSCTWCAVAAWPACSPTSRRARSGGTAAPPTTLLAFFLGHLAMHRIPLLWEFHKVHHSAAVLQPMTVMRRHPVNIMIDGTISGAMMGLAYGCIGWIGGGALQPATILGVNALLFIGLLAGFCLQHSHVWLSFGVLDRVLISPATHQLHHSANPDHHDRNFGNFLVIWDRLAGSALLPRAVAPAGG